MSGEIGLFGPYYKLAAQYGGVQLLEYLLTVTAGTSTVNKGLRVTLFNWAAHWNRADVVRFLYNLEREECPWDFSDWRSNNRLRVAQETSSLRLLKFIQEVLHIHQSRRTTVVNEQEHILREAARDNRLDTVAYLICQSTRADRNNGIDTVLHVPGDLFILLHAASSMGNVAVAEYLIQHGANPDWAIRPAAEYGQIDFVKVMLEAGRSIGRMTTAKAAAQGYWDIVLLLLDAGADVNEGTGKDSPLVQAIAREHTAMFNLLVKRGGNLYLNGTAQACVQRAKKDGLDSMLVLLAQHGVDVSDD
jgi:ankyrin repeat protein